MLSQALSGLSLLEELRVSCLGQTLTRVEEMFASLPARCRSFHVRTRGEETHMAQLWALRTPEARRRVAERLEALVTDGEAHGARADMLAALLREAIAAHAGGLAAAGL